MRKIIIFTFIFYLVPLIANCLPLITEVNAATANVVVNAGMNSRFSFRKSSLEG